MDYSSISQPDSDNDVVIDCKISGVTCQITNSAVPTLTRPYFFSSPNPILPLSNHFLDNGNSCIKELPFPILCDIFHQNIHHLENIPAICPNCQAFLPVDSFSEKVENCPFCHNSEIKESFVSFPNSGEIKIEQPKFIFLLIGNATDYFYDSISSFSYPLIFLTYNNDHFIMCQYKNEKFNENHLFESEIPPNAFCQFPKDKKVPHFQESKMYKADLNKILNELSEFIPKIESPIHIVVFNSVPHTCIESFHFSNATLSVCSSNSFICKCSESCHNSGGLFLPHSQSFNIDNMNHIVSSSIRLGKQLQNSKKDEDKFNNDLALVFPGQFYIQNGLKSVSENPINPVQIVLQTYQRTYCFTKTFFTKTGLKTFLYESSLPNMLVALSKTSFSFSDILSQYSKSLKDGLIIPHSQKYTLLYPTISPRRTIHQVLSMRPFIFQIQPVFRVIDFVSQNICTTISILLVLYENTIYVYVGSEVKKDTWESVIGVPPSSQMISFEIVDVAPTFQSDLWKVIRGIREMYKPYRIPVIVVPNESGRRVQMMKILDVDIVKGSNEVYKRYAEIARNALDQ
ncbi:hypothetical protein TRFO_24999 [Tritrichomonas foetus]|uniref:Uncharacterized protein n=1 Tax=Tritrichomonas foetus TaxID=1144522 RepID=A0A1J4KB28_9EUKA|nr:hypothetical protein TRFO_24999 [Tritrichomonas foetus]|eukprot:OHT06894.1 hypothetical protein TRFO_24999 [Tritrichomonas foetus]